MKRIKRDITQGNSSPVDYRTTAAYDRDDPDKRDSRVFPRRKRLSRGQYRQSSTVLETTNTRGSR